MARITWTDRANSGANSAISASIFNDIKTSVNNLYTELEDIINLSGSAGSESKTSRDGTTNYITPAAVYNSADEQSYIDLSSNGVISAVIKDTSIFSLSSGKTVTIGGPSNDWSTTVRGNLNITGSLRIGIQPDKFPILKIGTGSSYVTEDFVSTAILSSPHNDNTNLDGFDAGFNFQYSTNNVTEGLTKIKLHATNDGGEGTDDNINRIIFTLNATNKYFFFEDSTLIPKPPQTSNPTTGLLAISPQSSHEKIEYITIDALNNLLDTGGVTNAFTTASLFGSNIGGTFSSYTASAAFNRIRFQPISNLFMGMTNALSDGKPIITIGTSSQFTASWAHMATTASFTITSSFAFSASQAISSSYAVSASFAPTPTWNQTLTKGADAEQDIFINQNYKIYLGTTSDEIADSSKIYHDSTTSIGDLRIETNNNKNIILDTANKVGIGENVPEEKLDIGGNLKVQGAISASTLPASTTENTVVVHENGVLKSREFSALLGDNSINGYATASFGNAGEITAASSTSSFEFGFGSGLSGSIQNQILTIETSSNFVATLALTANTASYILADNIDQPFSNLYVTGDITASIVSASNGVTSSDVYINDWGSVSASLAAAVNSNDNLGNHTATQDLNLSTFDIFGVTHITASGYISASGGFIGDLTGTASYADYATSASYSISASHAEFADTAFSATTASHALNANTSITASYVANALYSASISNATITYYQFDGDTFVHTVNNVNDAVSASYASTASYVENAISASHVADAFTTATVLDDTITLTQFDGDGTNLTINNVNNAVSASYASTASYVLQAVSASYSSTASYVENAQTASYVTTSQTASYFDIEFSSPSQGTLRTTINGTNTDVDLGVQTGDNVTFANLTANGDTVKFPGIPKNSSILTPLVIDSTGRIYTGSEYTPAGGVGGGGTFDGFTASGDFGGNIKVPAGAILNFAGGNGLTTTKTGTYQLTIDADGLLSSSDQIASEISGAFESVSSSIAEDIETNTVNISTNTSNITILQASSSAGIRLEDVDSGFSLLAFETGTFAASGGNGLTVNVASNTITYTLNGVLSGSAQIATDISGAINSATSSVLNNYGLLSGSSQIATEISGAFNSVSASIATNITALEASASAGIFFANTDDPGFSLSLTETASFLASGDTYDNGLFDVVVNNNEVNYSLNLNSLGLLSSSQQIATDISGAINAATQSILNNYGLLSSSAQIAVEISGALSSIADNLGNHIAEMDLEMGDGATNYNINNVNNQNIFGTLSIESTGEIILESTNKISFNNDNNNTFIRANSDTPEDLEIHADQDILLQPDNNVGIGTSSPADKLHVGGHVRGTTFISTGGSGATPAFRFSADTDTGLYLASPGILALQVGPSATGELSITETQATFNVDTKVNGNITASGTISASNHLYASASNSNGNYNHVVVYDTGSGRFYYTGSYGTGGGTGTAGDANVLTLNNNTSNQANIGTANVNSTHTYLRAEFYAKSGSVVQAARTVFVWDELNGNIETTTVEDIRTHDTINLFDINSVSGSWDSNSDVRIYLNQYNGLNVNYKFRYILI